MEPRGSAVSKVVAALTLGPVAILLGHFVSVVIDFLVIALVVYFGVKALKLDKLDKTA